MRERCSVWLSIVLLAAVSLSAQKDGARPAVPDDVLGTWSGTWDGDGGSGGFDLTLQRGKEGATIGKVAVTGDPAYQAALRTIVFDGRKMTAKYDFTPQPAAEVTLKATFEKETAAGSWSLADPSTGNHLAGGSWKVTRNAK